MIGKCHLVVGTLGANVWNVMDDIDRLDVVCR